jgi:hypothetical protein
MTKNNRHLWVVEFQTDDGEYNASLSHVFDYREGARCFAKLCRESGEAVRIQKYVPESKDW